MTATTTQTRCPKCGEAVSHAFPGLTIWECLNCDWSGSLPTTAKPTSTWAVTKIAHPALRDVNDDCTECLALAGTAIDHARVTGSVGCTFGEVRGGVEHSVTVARAITVVTR